MGRGPLSKKTKQERAQEKAREAAQLLGIELPEEALEISPEHQEDKILEAVSVLGFFFDKGQNWNLAVCKQCGGEFAYRWEFSSVSYCSVNCIKIMLKNIAIDWDPNRPLGDRYRPYYKTRPAVIGPQALEIVQQILAETQEDELDNTEAESA